ncbi:aminoacyl-tRNA hydrolase [Erysipelothrix rhusiopathiae]|uniref:aminoacyl-tRNA hydrolase n=1 Tax=Erysipelothrix rhusiopathiae TaxID=1648 RepID=UPI00202B6C3E|nr:aminoacyl-tRNA hydrolase [Erysipelothrix rhusiopathiae]URQ77287.1 aminoacyl-tRNA hydrolase [Erysipelothrix rhusiopathiae]
MKVIVGLGNPGKQYENTRHNAGFLVIDEVASKLGVSISTNKFKALIAETFVGTEKVVLVKPQTFMNLSGESVGEVMRYYDVDLEDLLVISDDMDITVGSLRLREKGSSGGQKGVKSIIDHLGSNEFLRLKVGIGKCTQIKTVDWVLGKIDEETAISLGAQCVSDFISGKRTDQLMNEYNIRV